MNEIVGVYLDDEALQTLIELERDYLIDRKELFSRIMKEGIINELKEARSQA